jgi:hypothetical protein
MKSAVNTDQQPRATLALWLGIVGPPLIWLTQFEIKYALAGSTRAFSHGVLVASGLLSLAAVGALFVMSLRHTRTANASPLDRATGIVGRIHFMAVLGLMFGGLFFLLIAAQSVADLFFEPGWS